MTILNNQPARSGNMIDSEGNLKNIVDILAAKSSAAPTTYNEETAQDILNRSTPLSGNMIGSDGTVYNLVDLLEGIGGGGGSSSLASLTDVNLQNLSNGQIITYNESTQKWTNSDLSTYKGFNPDWTTDTTFQDFLDSVYEDEEALPGNVYLGQLECSGLPTGLNNAEAVVEILPSDDQSVPKVLHITVTSGNLSPYRWEYTYWLVGGEYPGVGWVSFGGSGLPEYPEQDGMYTLVVTISSGIPLLTWGTLD